jgi:hypothetical protein
MKEKSLNQFHKLMKFYLIPRLGNYMPNEGNMQFRRVEQLADSWFQLPHGHLWYGFWRTRKDGER